MKEIQLTKGYVALVDDDDYEKLNNFKWIVSNPCNSFYAYTYIKRKMYAMHRVIMNNPDGFQVDHINHNGLDNRKENLRIVTRSQNSMNTHKIKKSKYIYKGVRLIDKSNRTKPYGSQLKHGNKCYYLGTFETIIDAARAYDKKAKELFGEFACLNFPNA